MLLAYGGAYKLLVGNCLPYSLTYTTNHCTTNHVEEEPASEQGTIPYHHCARRGAQPGEGASA